VSDWRDIATAPTDGTRVLLAYVSSDWCYETACGQWEPARPGYRRAHWANDHQGVYGLYWLLRHQPTHWAPIPRMPVGQEVIPADAMPYPGLPAAPSIP
jgi:hypothetical protein